MHYKGCHWDASGLGGRLTLTESLSCPAAEGEDGQTQPAGSLHSGAFSPSRQLHQAVSASSGACPRTRQTGRCHCIYETCSKSKEEDRHGGSGGILQFEINLRSVLENVCSRCYSLICSGSLPHLLTDQRPFGPVSGNETQSRPINLALKWFLEPEERNSITSWVTELKGNELSVSNIHVSNQEAEIQLQ